jgi:hypothetical protein
VAKRNTVKAFGKWFDAQLAKIKEHPQRLTIECTILFVAGMFIEAVLSIDTIVTANRMVIAAGFTSYSIEVLNTTVFRYVIDDGMRINNAKLQSLALGSAAGAMLATGLL